VLARNACTAESSVETGRLSGDESFFEYFSGSGVCARLLSSTYFCPNPRATRAMTLIPAAASRRFINSLRGVARSLWSGLGLRSRT
jgi:hypothetical protein